MANSEVLEAHHVLVPTGHGGHDKIHYFATGPARTPPAPAVIWVSGLGTSSIGFAAAMRNVAAAGIRSYAPDRTGLGRSPGDFANDDASGPPATRTAQDMAVDLAAFLMAARIEPPYVLAMHSYGGVIGREFLAAHLQDVVGLVFIDANCQNATSRNFDPDLLDTFLGTDGINFHDDTGLTATQKLRPEEWQEAARGAPPPDGFERGEGGEAAERNGYYASCDALKRLPQYEEHIMGHKPVSVVKGSLQLYMEKAVAKAEAHDLSTKEVRDRVRIMFQGWDEKERELQTAQLQLAQHGYGRMVNTVNSAHYVHISEPELVGQEIAWVVQQSKERGVLEEWHTAQKKA